MRTTLTLDDDVAALLERLRRNRDASLKELVNEELRRGLPTITDRPKRREPFRTLSLARAGKNCRHRQYRRGALYCRGRELRLILIDANILIYAPCQLVSSARGRP